MGKDVIRQFIHRFRGYFTSLSAGIPPSISPVNQGAIYYDSDQQALLKSENAGNWVPLCTPSAQALTQATWFVDPVAGDDANDGATALTALATLEEYTARIGSGTVRVASTITIANPLVAIGGTITFRGDYRAQLTIQGEQTVVRSGTITALQVWLAAADQDGLLTDAGVATWVPDEDRAIVMTSGAASGALAWVAEDVTGGGDQCRYSPMWDDAGDATVNPAVLDTYDVVTMTTAEALFVMRHSGSIRFLNLHILDVAGSGGVRMLSGQTVLTNTRLETAGNDTVSGGTEAGSEARGCNIEAPGWTIESPYLFDVSGCLFRSRVLVDVGGAFNVADDCHWEAVEGVTVQGSGHFEIANGAGMSVFNMPGAADTAINLTPGASAHVRGRGWGTGNDGAGCIGVSVNGGANMLYSGTAVDRFGFAGATLVETNIAGDVTVTYVVLAAVGSNGANAVRNAAIAPGAFTP